jgi:hypothetical protein
MSRNEFVQQVLERLQSAPAEIKSDIERSVDQWWWINIEDNWRLTWYGYACLTDLNEKSWEFDFDIKDIRPWMYLTLSRKLKAPFYIVDNKKHAKLVVFDSRSAVMINLYGNLIRWLETLKQQ